MSVGERCSLDPHLLGTSPLVFDSALSASAHTAGPAFGVASKMRPSTRSPTPSYNYPSYQFSKGDYGADETAVVNNSDSCPPTATNSAYMSLTEVLKTFS